MHGYCTHESNYGYLHETYTKSSQHQSAFQQESINQTQWIHSQKKETEHECRRGTHCDGVQRKESGAGGKYNQLYTCIKLSKNKFFFSLMKVLGVRADTPWNWNQECMAVFLSEFKFKNYKRKRSLYIDKNKNM